MTGNPGLQENYKADYGERLWLIPSSTGAAVGGRAFVFKPRGRGPFPLAIINHGSHEDPRLRSPIDIKSFLTITRWFIQHGYVVALLERPGHGRAGGAYVETHGDCDAADFRAAGLATANVIGQAIGYLQTLEFVQRGGVIVVGHSAGGWGSLALASQPPAGVSAIIVFAPGRGGHAYGQADTNCSVERLIDAARSFGKSADIPSLWLYSANDTYFNPQIAKRIYDAFSAGGSQTEFYLLPPLKGYDGHFLMFVTDNKIWEKRLMDFLTRRGLLQRRSR